MSIPHKRGRVFCFMTTGVTSQDGWLHILFLFRVNALFIFLINLNTLHLLVVISTFVYIGLLPSTSPSSMSNLEFFLFILFMIFSFHWGIIIVS